MAHNGVMTNLKTSGTWYYTIDNGAVTIHGRTDDSPELIIPQYIEGLPVRHIGDRAFADQKITGLSLPYGIESIGYGAFYDHHIRRLIIPDTVRKIQMRAFGHLCYDLFQSASLYL